MKNILIINAHQRYEGFAEGKLNKTLADSIASEFSSRDFDVKCTLIENGYDIAEEIEKHEWADVIITQSPVYWFSNPWIYKKYIDEVFTTALSQGKLVVSDGRTRSDPSKQYGTGGLMQGKRFMLSLTWNAPSNAFGDKNQYFTVGKTEDDIFFPQTSVYKFCGVDIVPSFSCYDVLKNADVEGDMARLKSHLNTHFFSS